jgi:hypothetical protein
VRPIVAGLALAVVACGGSSAGTGSAQAFVVAEDTIPDGLVAGSGLEDIQDGWTVRYGKFLAVVGNFRAARQGKSDVQQVNDVFVIDMKSLPTSGLVIAQLEDLRAARWDKVGYDMPRADDASQ